MACSLGLLLRRTFFEEGVLIEAGTTTQVSGVVSRNGQAAAGWLPETREDALQRGGLSPLCLLKPSFKWGPCEGTFLPMAPPCVHTPSPGTIAAAVGGLGRK